MATPLIALGCLAALPLPSALAAGFAFLPGEEGFTLAAREPGESTTKQAGAHPGSLIAAAAFEPGSGELRDLRIHLPPGLLVNPTALGECTATAFQTPRPESLSGESCPSSTQVGVISLDKGGTTRTFGLFSLVPPFGSAAAIGASPWGVPLVFPTQLRESDYGLDLALQGVPQSFDLRSMRLTIWGTPWALAHDAQRGDCLDEETGGSLGTCGVFGGEGGSAVHAPESQIKSFLTMPTTPCGTSLPVTADAVSWQGEATTTGAALPPLERCNTSKAQAKVQLMTNEAAHRTGLSFTLSVNDGGGILNPAGIARPAIATAVAALPEGLTINPSLAAGLSTCTEAQFATETATSEPGAGCPNSSKIGSVTLEGTLGLAEPLSGSVYLATPFKNRFGAMIAVLLLARLPRRGLIVKSVGEIAPEPRSGRLVATFEELPRLLYTGFNLTLREGQRSALVSPSGCGPFSTEFSLADWAQPTSFRSESTLFFIDRGEAGGPCPAGGVPPFSPQLLAGSINPQPGAYTPFYLRMTRKDSEQEITSYSAALPPGLLGKIAGLSQCPDAAIEAAKAKSGTAEQEQPSCPDSSRIGRTMAGFGLGGTLAWAPGGLFLAGPYHGAPLSVVAIDSALIGPFDLGTVVVRQAVRVDPRTAQVSLDVARSDPIPHILGGIPLHLSDIRVYVERSGFMVNPTSCDPMQVTSTLGGAGADPFSSADDISSTSVQRYQLLGCSALGFSPALRLALRGGSRRGAYPALRAELRARPGDANLSAAAVTLPRAEFIAQEHLRQVCSRVDFAAQRCPQDSIYGRARAFTPLLDDPLEGNVYLRSGGGGLPELVADLRGPGGLRIEVPGRIDSVHQALRATFTDLPDAPLSRFVMTLRGGHHGLIQNEKDVCAFPQFANVRLIGHNNRGVATKPRLRARCRSPRKRKRAR